MTARMVKHRDDMSFYTLCVVVALLTLVSTAYGVIGLSHLLKPESRAQCIERITDDMLDDDGSTVGEYRARVASCPLE